VYSWVGREEGNLSLLGVKSRTREAIDDKPTQRRSFACRPAALAIMPYEFGRVLLQTAPPVHDSDNPRRVPGRLRADWQNMARWADKGICPPVAPPAATVDNTGARRSWRYGRRQRTTWKDSTTHGS
jgi:hypothetical protein